jgi:hypothetical protein
MSETVVLSKSNEVGKLKNIIKDLKKQNRILSQRLNACRNSKSLLQKSLYQCERKLNPQVSGPGSTMSGGKRKKRKTTKKRKLQKKRKTLKTNKKRRKSHKR